MLKRFAACIREYKKQTILTPIYVTVEVIIDVVIPLVMASLIDQGISAGSMAFSASGSVRPSTAGITRSSWPVP